MSDRLPSFVIIGASKAATSSLRALLRNHKQVFMAQGGVETRFFAHDDVYARGIEWYTSLFSSAPSSAIAGECSNIYSDRDRFPHAAERLAQHLPQAKLIYSVRDPLPRIASLWTQLRSHGGENVHHDFGTALRRDRALLVESSNYWRQLEPYRALFPDSQILIVFFEEFASDPARVMIEVCRFIGVAPLEQIEPESAHQNPSTGKVGAPPWLSHLRRSAVFRSLRRGMPARLRARVREQLLFREIPRPVWTPELRRWALDQLRDDSLTLLRYSGRPSSLWTLD